ncbi:sodium/potassium/calcium exchanger 4-like [Dermacentor silvarum]|uniref:sodium/potassium/calcium exchanger 4-like n=1 Tax=Dermacentor silvarum TaxID=543639 RepID=UPI002100B798|nr:sodium/potassium/calcium exchanger 4-like [Dermacentor silvarum]
MEHGAVNTGGPSPEWSETPPLGARRFVAGRARQRAVRKAVALLAFLAACCALSRLKTVTPETNGYATARRLLSTGAAAEADDVPGPPSQEPEVAPAPRRHVSPLSKRALHAENSTGDKIPTREGDEPKPKPSAGGNGGKGKPRDKDEAEAAGNGEGKQTNSQPRGEGTDDEKAKGETPGEPGQDEPRADEKPPDGSGKKAEEKSQQVSKGQPASADKEPGTKPKQENEQKPTKPDEENRAKVKSKDELPQPDKESKPKADQGSKTDTHPGSKPKSGNETDGAKPVPKTSDKSTSGEGATDSKSKGEPKEEDKPIQGNEKPREGGAEGEEPKPPGEETGPSRNASKNATKAAEAEEDRRSNKTKGEEVEEIRCIRPAYHEFPPDLFSHEARAKGGVIVHILVVLYMFYALAVVCDDYFIASLEECCARLNLSEDVAGATFMAAGSSAPELFTAILGVLIAKGDVGTGTIVGSAVFNVLFVIGLCGICSGKEVPVTWWPLFRDSTFYAFTVVILILVIYDGEVTWYDSLFMLLLYGVYIDIMKYNKRIHLWVAATFGIHEEEQTSLGLTSAGYDAKNYSSYVPFNNEIDDFAQQNATRNTRPLDEVIRDSRRRPTLYEAALRMLMTRYFRPKTRFWAAAKRITHEHKRICRGEIQHLPSQTSLDPNDMVRRGKSSSVDVALSTEADWKRVPSLREGPWALLKWVLQAPLLATLHYTVPDCRTATGKRLFMLSFIMSIFWTAAFSYVMVWMVTLIGYTMGIPDTIMGITFLAAGTSIPDAYASLLVSRQGQGDMAIANSIGSNVFDILIGLALPWLIQTGMVEPGSLAYINSGGLVWSVVLLFLTIIITIYTIHRSHWLLTRKLGIFLMVVYAIFLVICSAVEFNLLGYVNPPMCAE